MRNLLLAMAAMICVSCSGGNSDSSTAITPSQLLGDWELNCSPFSSTDPRRAYWTSNDKITDSLLVATANFYEDSNCTVSGSPGTRVLTASLDFPDGSTSTQLGEAQHLDVVIQNVEYDGAALTEDSNEPIYEFIGVPIYDLYLILDGTLYFGQETTELNGQSPNDRYGALAQQYPYTRAN